MSNAYFKFKKFIVHQDKCAMKVGTDGTLLGAWASAPSECCHILDIGAGTGLISLMMAQRFPQSSILGVDIDYDAVMQAKDNVSQSCFSDRIKIIESDINYFQSDNLFGAIVSNPPYFIESLTCPDHQRTTARHTISLTYESLIHAAYRLLDNNGIFSVIIPSEFYPEIEKYAYLEGFFLNRICSVKTTPSKEPKRQLIEFRKQPINKIFKEVGVIEIKPGIRSEWYQQLTKDFYLK